jgi:hypothetical protein
VELVLLSGAQQHREPLAKLGAEGIDRGLARALANQWWVAAAVEVEQSKVMHVVERGGKKLLLLDDVA